MLVWRRASLITKKNFFSMLFFSILSLLLLSLLFPLKSEYIYTCGFYVLLTHIRIADTHTQNHAIFHSIRVRLKIILYLLLKSVHSFFFIFWLAMCCFFKQLAMSSFPPPFHSNTIRNFPFHPKPLLIYICYII